MRADKTSASTRVVCGGIAGCTAKTILAPLERARIMQQVSGGTMGVSLRTVLREEGVSGLWAGNTANLARVFPLRGIAFAVNDWLNMAFTPTDKLGASVAKFAVGGAAGLVSTTATYPLDLVRGRQAAEVMGASRRNFALALVGVARQEGIAALWRGAPPTIFGAIPFEGIRFGVVGLLHTRDVERRPAVKAAHGAVAGFVAGLVTFPNDTVRRILQQRDQPYRGYFDCVRQIYRNHGIRRFYFGLWPNLIKAVPSAAVQFGVYELLITWSSGLRS
ncbi:hypothetical protein CTAYLR_002159 [Chrysophaeum taylorii]|uniref:Uncharacterized protein n=1 Tax=Chrysophaeum taylorii TaxID=2483200 RepID=A0AAD7UPS8_9STRA|nr:hypothetical protein CTAYLR_002159 [Chrysophaeum taylorii]